MASVKPLVILDATIDERFRQDPLVVSTNSIRFYAGAGILGADGRRIGTFSIFDAEPRGGFGARQIRQLVGFAAIVAERLEKRRVSRTGRILNSFSEATGVALITCNGAGTITFWNEAASTLFGYPAEDAIGHSLNLIIPTRFQLAHGAGLARVASGGAATLNGKRVEVIARRHDGSEFPAELALSIWNSSDGIGFGAQIHDITERRERENKLRHLANHDELTGLLNRSGFRDCIDQCLLKHASGALLALDLDGFKQVNDTFGHKAGDTLLQMVALRMTAAVEGGGSLARVGGDEFALLLPGCTDLFRIVAAAKSVLDAFSNVFPVGDHEVTVGVSIGIALAPLHADEADELVVRADLALFRAKKQSGSAYCLFDAAMASEHTARRAFKDELRQAYERGEWRLFYQPQVNLETGALIGVEALLRWQHPTRGLLQPSAFMSVLENHLVSYEVGCWVIDEACRQLAEWRALELDIACVSVNLFGSQFQAGTLGSVVSDALMVHGLQPNDLELEITETIAIRYDDDALEPLRSLFDAGVGIALDDFGTGFASLSTLQRFPLTRLKIDRSFVVNIVTDRLSSVIVKNVAAIGHGIGLSVIAEGIETEDQEHALLAIGCDEGQGYRYSKAVDGEAMMDWAFSSGPQRILRNG
jgi:diguanylate cyclase (GGDEF)-like protein/PAS domain S-box-containing protein